jgi:hypothetical protein
MYLIPPMDDEPPVAYVDFVTTHLGELRRETTRLTGGDPDGTHLYMDVLADVAGHWRRLCLLARLRHRDAPGDYLTRRLAIRTRQWRDEQIYDVDMRVLALSTPSFPAPFATTGSIALRKAAVLPTTARRGVRATADAGIAWVQAYRKQQWYRLGRQVAFGVILVGGLIQIMSLISTY